MKRLVRYHPAVKLDLREAHNWYESRREGLGEEFLSEVRKIISYISNNPEMYETVRGDVRRGVTSRFPYLVLYRIQPQRIVILGVFHTSRDPLIWDERI